MLPFIHLYQACFYFGLCEFLVGTFQLPGPEKYAYLSGSWKLKLAKPKDEGTPTVGSISTQRGLYRGDSLVPIHHLPVPGGKCWMGTAEIFLVYQNIIFKFVVLDHEFQGPFNWWAKISPVQKNFQITTPVNLSKTTP